MRCRRSRTGAKEFYEDHYDEYDEARAEQFAAEFEEFMQEYMIGNKEGVCEINEISEDDVQGFLDSFTFPDRDDWLADEYESMIDSCADQAYEEERDRRMGI
jgi:hypothetical protein